MDSQGKGDSQRSGVNMWTENKNYSKTKINSTRQVKIDKWGAGGSTWDTGTESFSGGV